MTTKPFVKPVLRATLLSLVSTHPGITHAEAVKCARVASPSHTAVQTGKCLANLVYVAKKVIGEGRGDDRKYYLVGADAPKKPTAPKLERPTKAKPTTGAGHAGSTLGMVFDENDYIRIRNADVEITLDLEEAARVARFIQRIQAVNLLP